jgi:hypothetical protein
MMASPGGCVNGSQPRTPTPADCPCRLTTRCLSPIFRRNHRAPGSPRARHTTGEGRLACISIGARS